MNKIYVAIMAFMLAYSVGQAQTQKCVLIGGSSADNTNGWFELGCEKMNAQFVNKAVDGETIGDAANKLFAGNLYTRQELETMTTLVIMYNQNVNVFDPSLIKENIAEYTMPLNPQTDQVIAYDYVIKKYISDCYNLKDEPTSVFYQSLSGKPAVIVLCTDWHNGSTTYNNSIRLLAQKWGLKLIEFDKYVGFSSEHLHPNTKQQYSMMYGRDTQVINGTVFGSNPERSRYSFIQGKMAKIFKEKMEDLPDFQAPVNGWNLVFEDNFNGNAVDVANWGIYLSAGHVGNGLRSPSAISVENGNLVITAKMKDGQIVSGGMAHKINYLYGRFVFRVRTDKDPSMAMNGVVLTWPQSGRWPLDGENDIYETGTKAERESFETFIHFGNGEGTIYNQQYHYVHPASAYDWHIIMMDWSANSLKIYRDGVMVWELTDKKGIPQVPHHLCLQLDAFKAVMGDPVKMYVDWVMIYQPK